MAVPAGAELVWLPVVSRTPLPDLWRNSSRYADPTGTAAVPLNNPIPSGLLAFLPAGGAAPRQPDRLPTPSVVAFKTDPANLEVRTYPFWRSHDAAPLLPTPAKPPSFHVYPGVPIPVDTTMVEYSTNTVAAPLPPQRVPPNETTLNLLPQPAPPVQLLWTVATGIVRPLPRGESRLAVDPVSPISVDAVYLPPQLLQPTARPQPWPPSAPSFYAEPWEYRLSVVWLGGALGVSRPLAITTSSAVGFQIWPVPGDPQFYEAFFTSPTPPSKPLPCGVSAAGMPPLTFFVSVPVFAVYGQPTVPQPPGPRLNASVSGDVDMGQVVDVRPWAALLSPTPPLRAIPPAPAARTWDTSHALFQTTIDANALGFPGAWTQNTFPAQPRPAQAGASTSVLTLTQQQQLGILVPFVQSPEPFRPLPVQTLPLRMMAGEVSPWLSTSIIIVPGPYQVIVAYLWCAGDGAGQIVTLG